MARYSVNNYTVETLLSNIKSGSIAIPEMQRPFVWDSSKVRDLVDSLYKGFPVGYIIVWQNPDVKLKDGTKSSGKKILIDGQQRITAMAAAIVGQEVLDDHYKWKRISIRHELVENQQLQAVISMPSGVFKPYAGVSTAILIFTKTNAGGTENVWFYDMKADGYSLDDKRSEIKENDIPDIIARFHNRETEADRGRTEQSFFVPKQEIVDNGYDLSINKYKKVDYVAVEYPSTQEIMTNLRELEMQIGQTMDELEKLLGL